MIETPCKDMVSHVQPLHAWSWDRLQTRLCHTEHRWQLQVPMDPHRKGVRFPPWRGYMYVRDGFSCIPEVGSRAYPSSDKA